MHIMARFLGFRVEMENSIPDEEKKHDHEATLRTSLEDSEYRREPKEIVSKLRWAINTSTDLNHWLRLY